MSERFGFGSRGRGSRGGRGGAPSLSSRKRRASVEIESDDEGATPLTAGGIGDANPGDDRTDLGAGANRGPRRQHNGRHNEDQHNDEQQEAPKATGRTARLFVGSLVPDTSDTDVRSLFARHGMVLECFVSSRGFAFLKMAFTPFGVVERAVHVCDERGRPTGEGIVEFERKQAAAEALRRIQQGVFLLTTSPVPISAETLEVKDEDDGLTERNIPPSSAKQHEREQGPRFAPMNSFEYEHGMRWKELYQMEAQRKEQLEAEFKEARAQLEQEMDLAAQDYQAQQIREELRRRQAELDQLESQRQERLNRMRQQRGPPGGPQMMQGPPGYGGRPPGGPPGTAGRMGPPGGPGGPPRGRDQFDDRESSMIVRGDRGGPMMAGPGGDRGPAGMMGGPPPQGGPHGPPRHGPPGRMQDGEDAPLITGVHKLLAMFKGDEGQGGPGQGRGPRGPPGHGGPPNFPPSTQSGGRMGPPGSMGGPGGPHGQMPQPNDGGGPGGPIYGAPPPRVNY